MSEIIRRILVAGVVVVAVGACGVTPESPAPTVEPEPTTVSVPTTALPTPPPEPAPVEPPVQPPPAPVEPPVQPPPPPVEPAADCDPSYPGVCIPPAPPDLDCPDVAYSDFAVQAPDPHGFDRDQDGRGCE